MEPHGLPRLTVEGPILRRQPLSTSMGRRSVPLSLLTQHTTHNKIKQNRSKIICNKQNLQLT
jgi:hypothetical protein